MFQFEKFNLNREDGNKCFCWNEIFIVHYLLKAGLKKNVIFAVKILK